MSSTFEFRKRKSEHEGRVQDLHVAARATPQATQRAARRVDKHPPPRPRNRARARHRDSDGGMKTSDLTRHAVRVRTVQSTARGKKTSHAAAKLASYFRNKPPLGYILIFASLATCSDESRDTSIVRKIIYSSVYTRARNIENRQCFFKSLVSTRGWTAAIERHVTHAENRLSLKSRKPKICEVFVETWRRATHAIGQPGWR